jgi:YD repeat-containing protein
MMGRSMASAQFGTNGGKAFRREKKVSEKGLVTRRVYDAKTGLDAAQIDAAGRTTVFTYDATRRKVKESHYKPDGFATGGKSRKLVRETRSQVDPLRGVSMTTDALGNVTQSIADIFGRTITQIDALGNRTEMLYNRGGELIEQRDPMGRATRFVYDALGRRVEVILPAPKAGEKNPVQKTVYNALGQVIQQIDPLGNTTTTEYDAFGRRSAIIDAEGGRTEFTYDASGKMLSLTDPVGNVASYVYDDAGRMVSETNALGKTRKFEYEGRLPVRKTDRNGRVTTFEYNDFGKPIAEKWLDVSGKIVKTLAFDYNVLGHLTKVDDGVTTFAYSRNEDGHELTTTMMLAGLQNPIVQNTEYDILGRRTHIATVFGAEPGFANEYAYTKTGRVESIVQDGKRVEYQYDAAGMQMATLLFDHGNEVATVSQTYDGMGRLAGIDQKHGTETIAEYLYSWDAANRITSMNDANYGYDATNQLTSAVYEKLPEESYQYDANGNLKVFETGKNNQLLSDGVFDYKYDDEGNRIAKVSKDSKTEYFWDHRNRLVRVLDNGKSVEYDYDYQNRLVRRSDELFVHDGWQIACSLKNGKVEHRYLWGATQDELLAMDDALALRDHLNTVRKVVDAGGALFPIWSIMPSVR